MCQHHIVGVPPGELGGIARPGQDAERGNTVAALVVRRNTRRVIPVMAQSPSARVRSLVASFVSLIVNGETAPDGRRFARLHRVSPIAVILHRL